MQETTETLATPLSDAQLRAGASFAVHNGRKVPADYGSLSREYEVLRDGVALVDRSAHGRLRVTGSDALDLLNRLSTNKLVDLAPGEGASTVLTTPKGRIVDLLLVMHQDDSLLVVTSPQTPGQVVEWVDFYTFGEDIVVEDVTEATALITLMGPKAAELLDPVATRLEPFGSASLPLAGFHPSLFRTDPLGIPGYDILVAASEAECVWETLTAMGAVPVGETALEMLRLEQGVPRHGMELGEDFNPLEAELLSSISFDKGCYTGQEVVLRLMTYNKVQRRLVGLALGSNNATAGAMVEAEGKEVGQLTSVAYSPRLGGRLALAYVRGALAEVGQELGVKSGDTLHLCSVVALPVQYPT